MMSLAGWDKLFIGLELAAAVAVLSQAYYAIRHDLRHPTPPHALTRRGWWAVALLIVGTVFTAGAKLGREEISDRRRQAADDSTKALQAAALNSQADALRSLNTLLQLQRQVRADQVRLTARSDSLRDSLARQTSRIVGVARNLAHVDTSLRAATDSLVRMGARSASTYTTMSVRFHLGVRVDATSIPTWSRVWSACDPQRSPQGDCRMTPGEINQLIGLRMFRDSVSWSMSLFARKRHEECTLDLYRTPPPRPDAEVTALGTSPWPAWAVLRGGISMIFPYAGPDTATVEYPVMFRSNLLMSVEDLDGACAIITYGWGPQWPDSFAGFSPTGVTAQVLPRVAAATEYLLFRIRGRYVWTDSISDRLDAHGSVTRAILHIR